MDGVHGQFARDAVRAAGAQGACRSPTGGCRQQGVGKLAGPDALNVTAINSEHAAFRFSAAATRLTLADATGIFGSRRVRKSAPVASSGTMFPGAGSLGFSAESSELNAILSAVRTAITPILERNGIDPNTEDIDLVASTPGLAKELIEALPSARALFGAAAFPLVDSVRSRTPAADGVVTSCSTAAASARARIGNALRGPKATSRLDRSGTLWRAASLSPRSLSSDDAPSDGSGSDDPLDDWFIDLGLPGPTFGCPPAGDAFGSWRCDTSFVSTLSNCSESEASNICEGASFLQDRASEISGIPGEALSYPDLLPDFARSARGICVHTLDDAPHGEATEFAIQGYAASWTDATDVVEFYPAFHDAGLSEDIIGPDEFRAGVILHELVHGLEADAAIFSSTTAAIIAAIFGGTVAITTELPDSFDRQGACGAGTDRSRCTSEPGTEWRAAFIQAKFYGMGDCGAELFACAYVRQVCTVDYYESLWQTALDVAACYLGVTTVLLVCSIIVLVTAVGILTQGALIAAVTWLFGGTAVVLLLALLFIVLIDETPLG